jgi:hypothetical protein
MKPVGIPLTINESRVISVSQPLYFGNLKRYKVVRNFIE